MNASYVCDNYLYRATSHHKNRLYAKARKENYDNVDRSPSPTIYPFGMNTQGGYSNFIFETNGQQKVYTFFCHETKIKLA